MTRDQWAIRIALWLMIAGTFAVVKALYPGGWQVWVISYGFMAVGMGGSILLGMTGQP